MSKPCRAASLATGLSILQNLMVSGSAVTTAAILPPPSVPRRSAHHRPGRWIFRRWWRPGCAGNRWFQATYPCQLVGSSRRLPDAPAVEVERLRLVDPFLATRPHSTSHFGSTSKAVAYRSRRSCGMRSMRTGCRRSISGRRSSLRPTGRVLSGRQPDTR